MIKPKKIILFKKFKLKKKKKLNAINCNTKRKEYEIMLLNFNNCLTRELKEYTAKAGPKNVTLRKNRNILNSIGLKKSQ